MLHVYSDMSLFQVFLGSSMSINILLIVIKMPVTDCTNYISHDYFICTFFFLFLFLQLISKHIVFKKICISCCITKSISRIYHGNAI